MIFKYCVWPALPKEDDAKVEAKNLCGDVEFRKMIVGSVLRCCPCVFRWRRAIGIAEGKETEIISTVTEVHRLNNTPIIALRSNQGPGTMYAVN